MNHLSLSELNGLVREVISLSMDDAYWIVAEVSELRTAANGHCYMELVEKDENGKGLRAKASAHVWKNTWQLLRMHFEEETGQVLAAGMKILVEVEVEFHELYGFSLNITDVDPTYTLGDMARRRQEILQQLEADGVKDLNKELTLPRPLLRIAVVSSATAAGFGDFTRQLEASPYNFRTKLFPAIMQGDRVEESIIAALDEISLSTEDYDCVCILRGGGAASDLQGFESYPLATNVAQFPIPVLTGIGHERDDTVIDFVAHTRLKTPTAVAAFLIDRATEELEHLAMLGRDIYNNVSERLHEERTRYENAARRLQLNIAQSNQLGRERILRLHARIEKAIELYLLNEHNLLTKMWEKLPQSALVKLQREQQRTELLKRHVALMSPERILALGYSITRANGRIIKSADDVCKGALIETTLADGSIRSNVLEISMPNSKS